MQPDEELIEEFEPLPIPVPTLDDLKAGEALIHQEIADLEARK